MEWIQIGVLILSGFGEEVIPSTRTISSIRYPTIDLCEADLTRMRLNVEASASRVKTSGVFMEDDYEQIVVSSPVQLLAYGKGVIHHSCIPIPER